MSHKKICFVGLDNYPVLNPIKGNDYFGGESVQQTLLAKAFRDSGYDVSMIVKDHGQPQGEIIDGIQVWKTFKEHEGLPVLRFFYPRLTSIITALKKADADIYYQSCASSITGIVARFCKKNNRKFIFRLAHDSDCIPGKQIIRFWRDRKLYEYGLRRTTLIAAQGFKQVDLLKKHYQIDSIPVNMTVELPDNSDDVVKDIDVLWVNNYRDFKRPELVLELAKLLPEYNITMIGGSLPGHEALFDNINKQSVNIDNLNVIGPIPYHDVNRFFLRAKVFINTSEWEGFPNSFLQAWIRGVPVVSFFDPDDLIVNQSMGLVPKDVNDMASNIKHILSDNAVRAKIAETAKKYVIEKYAPISIAKYYESLFV